ncbi:ATP synthase, F1 delta subunit [Thermoanaerobacter kivui]|uniref:ATP synthase subunit delta n=1 Tax=Thermoanaerobacter kivui TaxID=2325 RepID=A0A097APS7_THEKI|nr:ATP synthase F1 subunit delta [Thermoanaerobacter kivui]AIS51829.1 ATP synthase, F1 delta subunit [Thermoanaerobacter kivui]
MAQIIAKRYAYALFDVAKQHDKVKEYYEELNKAIEIIRIEEVKKIFKNKSINKAQKIKFMEQVLAGIDKDILNFIKVVISKHREDLIEDIEEQFQNLYKEYFKIVDAKVVSAYPLKESTIQKLKNSLESKLGKHVNIEPIVDKSILGGLKLIIGNTIIDGSVKARLTALLKNMQQAV